MVQHERILMIFLWPLEKGFPEYLIFMAQLFFLCGLGYVAFFVSPVLVGRYREYVATPSDFRILLLGLTGAFVIAEALILSGIVHAARNLMAKRAFRFRHRPDTLEGHVHFRHSSNGFSACIGILCGDLLDCPCVCRVDSPDVFVAVPCPRATA